MQTNKFPTQQKVIQINFNEQSFNLLIWLEPWVFDELNILRDKTLLFFVIERDLRSTLILNFYLTRKFCLYPDNFRGKKAKCMEYFLLTWSVI